MTSFSREEQVARNINNEWDMIKSMITHIDRTQFTILLVNLTHVAERKNYAHQTQWEHISNQLKNSTKAINGISCEYLMRLILCGTSDQSAAENPINSLLSSISRYVCLIDEVAPHWYTYSEFRMNREKNRNKSQTKEHNFYYSLNYYYCNIYRPMHGRCRIFRSFKYQSYSITQLLNCDRFMPRAMSVRPHTLFHFIDLLSIDARIEWNLWLFKCFTSHKAKNNIHLNWARSAQYEIELYASTLK